MRDSTAVRGPGPDAPGPLAELREITKRFGALLAVDEASLTIGRGEIHALVGENGAGKSTLMNIAYGLLRADAGEVVVESSPLAPGSAAAALRAGVGMVHQHFKLVGSLTVAENIFLGRESTRHGIIERRAALRSAEQLSERHGLRVPAGALVSDLTVGERQRVEILRILSHEPRLIVLDEPTAVLAPQEVDDLFGVIRRLREAGSSTVLVTHKLDEVRAVADRISVMRRGRMVATTEADAVSEREVAELMVGRTVVAPVRGAPRQLGDSALAVRDVCAGPAGEPLRLDHVSFEVRAGEIVGIAGVDGNGQTELAEVIAGLRAPSFGSVSLLGRDATGLDPGARRACGLGHVPEDRFDRGASPSMSIADNLALTPGLEPDFRWGPFMRRKRLLAWARQALEEFDVRGANDPSAPMLSLSGGNMQRVILARELLGRPRVLVACQPCRGVDIGAVASIHRMLLEGRDRGMAILLVSTDLSEILALSDRVLVLLRGALVAELDGRATTREEIGRHMLATGAGGELAA